MNKQSAKDLIEEEFINIMAAQFGVSEDEEARGILRDVIFKGGEEIGEKGEEIKMGTTLELAWEEPDEPYEYVNNMTFLNGLSKHAWTIYHQGRTYCVDGFFSNDFRDELVVWADCEFAGRDSFGVEGSDFDCCTCEDEKLCKFAGSEFKHWSKTDPHMQDCGCRIDVKLSDIGKTIFFEKR